MSDSAIDDVQGMADSRRIDINRVGIQGLTYPITVQDGISAEQRTVATLNMHVSLAHDLKGTHMSRFIEILERIDRTVSVHSFGHLLEETARYLESPSAFVEIKFPYFIRKAAPVSGAKSFMNYAVSLSGERHESGAHTWLRATVPVTSLCPCSKKISAYGAHSQRSHITIAARIADSFWFEDQ